VTHKFFSLFHGNAIRMAPGKKIIPSDSVAKLLDARAVLKKVKKDALSYKQDVVEECEKLKERAQKEGYEEGFKEWAEEIIKLQEQIDRVRAEYSKMLAPVTLKATQKIVGDALAMSPEAAFNIVSNALKPVLQHKRITIYVNKDDLAALEKSREKLKNLFENIEVLSIGERDDVSPGGCVIETEGGIINARLENQWAILERAFEKLFRDIVERENKPKSKVDI